MKEQMIKMFGFNNRFLEWYINIMSKRVIEPYAGEYYEKHHLFPKSIFGKNQTVVKLSLKEHYIAHYLLFRAYQIYNVDKKNLHRSLTAILAMSGFYNKFRHLDEETIKFSSKRYETLRTIYKENGLTEEHIESLKSGQRKRFSKSEERKKLSESRKKYIASTNGEYQKTISKQMKEVLSTEEQKERMRLKIESQKEDPSFEEKRKLRANTKEAMDKRKKTFFERYTTEQRSEMARKAASGRVWVCKNFESKSIKKEELDIFISEGWSKGRFIPKRNKVE